MVDKDLENYNTIMKNYAQAQLMFKNQKDAEEEKLKTFLKQMDTVFKFIDSLEYKDPEKLFTNQFDPSNLAISVELIADASPVERFILRLYRELLINRLNSYTKNRKLIYDILLRYFMQFLNCYEEHANENLIIQRMIMYSAIGLQSETSQAFMDFVQGPLADEISRKKHELEKGMKGEKGNWKDGAIK